jgi:uncharacterized membrane protein
MSRADIIIGLWLGVVIASAIFAIIVLGDEYLW